MSNAAADFEHRREALLKLLTDPSFLQIKGIGNEVGIFMFCFDPSLELAAQDLARRIVRDSQTGKLPCRIIERNLYDVMLQICEDKRILDKIGQQEERRGSAAMLEQLRKVASPEAFARALAYEPHEPGDVLLITGVGEVCPVLRAHVLLDNIQSHFSDVPIVLMYPGTYSGQTMSLFSTLPAANYYRAFDIV